ncbi:MAG: hypothetical protein QF733_10170 [Phycisphaerales bacterium]|jgi:uncharacterized Zn finger protein|nr:hypothetical protein [Phycisphaerales bacterium]
MSRVDVSSRAPRPSRRRGGRLKLKVDEQVLLDGRFTGDWLAVIESIVGQQSMQEGLLAARDGAVRTLNVERGCIAGPVQADGEPPRDVAMVLKQIDESGWKRLIEAMACEAVWAAKLLEGAVPEGLEDLFRGCGTPVIPEASDIEATVKDAGRRDGWRIASLAWIAAERMHRDPLAILMVRGMPSETLVERIGHHRALRSTEESVAHPPVIIDTDLATGPLLADSMETWWRPHAHVDRVDREPHVRHALLRRLGPSTLGGKFPLSGLLATIYDEAAAEAARLLDAPLGDEDASG